MRLEILNITIFDIDFSFGEGAAVVILGIIGFLTALSSPLWR